MTRPGSGAGGGIRTFGHPAVAGAVVLLLFGIVPLFWVGAGVISVRNDPAGRSALDYDVLTQTLDSTMREVATSRMLRVQTAPVTLAGGVAATLDTLVVTASKHEFPSFADAGFLNDEVRKYNRFQRWRLEAGRLRAAWFDSLAPYNPSIFRTRLVRDDSLALARSVASYSLRVSSPFEDTRWMTVLARASRHGPGLVGHGVRIPLDGSTAIPVAVAGQPRRCHFDHEAARDGDAGESSVAVYCASTLGRPRRVRPQATIRTGRSGATIESGYAPIAVDGGMADPGGRRDARTGTLVEINPLAPLIFSTFRTGLLSTGQWINGRVRRVTDGPSTLRFLAGLGRRTSSRTDTALVRVSVDDLLSAELADSLRSAFGPIARILDFAAVTIADASTGEVLAVAEVGAADEPHRLRMMEPTFVGSAVKPILAAAILSERPELASLETRGADERVEEIFGLQVGGFRSALNCTDPPPGGWVNLHYFVRCSNNRYAATLVLASMSERRPEGGGMPRVRSSPGGSAFRLRNRTFSGMRPDIPLGTGNVVQQGTLTESALATGLVAHFGMVADPEALGGVTRRSDVWRGLRTTGGDSVHPPRQLWPEVSQPMLMGRGTRGTTPALLSAYSYGGWENRWTLLDLTQAFGRLITNRELQLTFAPLGPYSPRPSSRSLGFHAHSWYPTLVDGLRRVGVDGTAIGLNASWQRLLGDTRVVYAKTGTLNETDDRLFLRTLVFAVGNGAPARRAPLACGVVGTIYVRLKELPTRGASMPAYHTAVAKEQVGPVLARHWRRLGLCPEAQRRGRG